MITRTETRELLMQAVFQMEMQKDFDSQLLEQLIAEKKMSGQSEAYIKSSFDIIKNNIDEIDGLIEKYSKNWKISRMPKVDLAILRVAVCEIIYQDDTPAAVAINEAVKMAGRFSDEKSGKFINGVLGSIERSMHE